MKRIRHAAICIVVFALIVDISISVKANELLMDDVIEKEAAQVLNEDRTVCEIPESNTDLIAPKLDVNENIASGTYENVRWVINANGKLMVNGSGNFRHQGSAPWKEYAEYITKAEVNLTNADDLSDMFEGCVSLEEIDLSRLDTSRVSTMAGMFSDCRSLTSLNVSDFNTSNVTNMSRMFYGCSGLTSLDLSGFNTSNVMFMYAMFENCSGLVSLDLSGFDTSNVMTMCSEYSSPSLSHGMFSGCSSLTHLNISGFDTSNVKGMCKMFYNCKNLVDLDVSGFNTSNVKCMNSMFYGCNSLTTLDVSGFDTSNVTDMNSMFAYCTALKGLDLSNMTVNEKAIGESVDSCMWDLFVGDCSNLLYLKCPGILKADVILPGGGWIDLSTGEPVAVTTYSVRIVSANADQGKIFVRNSAIDRNGNKNVYDISVKRLGDGAIYINDAFLSNEESTIRVYSNDTLTIRIVPTRIGHKGIMAIDGAKVPELTNNSYTLKNISSDHNITVTFEEYISGDVTGDGKVAMGDVVKVARAISGSITLTPDEFKAADVTGDGVVAMGDVVKMARFVAGSIKKLR